MLFAISVDDSGRAILEDTVQGDVIAVIEAANWIEARGQACEQKGEIQSAIGLGGGGFVTPAVAWCSVHLQNSEEQMNERPLYEALFEMYSTQRSNRHSHALRLANAARRFSARTAETLGFPDSYFELSDGSSRPWVTLYELREDDDAPTPLTGGRVHPESFLPDGTLRFGLGVAISAELKSFPKEYFWAGYKLSAPSMTDQMTLTEEWGKKESFTLSEDSSDFDSAIANFIETLRSALTDGKPATSDKRSPSGSIGFLAEIQ